MLLGLVFGLAAAAKATAIPEFLDSIKLVGFVPEGLVAPLGLFRFASEAVVAFLLLTGIRHRLALYACIGLLLLFSTYLARHRSAV